MQALAQPLLTPETPEARRSSAEPVGEDEEHWRLDQACWHIQDAMDGVRRVHPQRAGRARLAYTLHVQLMPCLPYVAAAYLGISFFEAPQWCVAIKEDGGPDLCDDPRYPSFDMPHLPFRLNLALELLCLLPLGLDVFLRALSQGSLRFIGSRRQCCTALLVLGALGDIVWAYATPVGWVRAAPYLRAGLMVAHSLAVQQQFFVLQRAIPSFTAAAVLLLFFLTFAAYIATLLFPAGSPEGDAILPDLPEAMWQLLILLTTANFPDVMMPAYTQCREAALFFAAFVMLGVFFLMNYLLAVVYGSYTDAAKEIAAAAAERQRASLDAAFEALDWEGAGSLDRDRLSAMLDHLPHATFIALHAGVRRPPPPVVAIASVAASASSSSAPSPTKGAPFSFTFRPRRPSPLGPGSDEASSPSLDSKITASLSKLPVHRAERAAAAKATTAAAAAAPPPVARAQSAALALGVQRALVFATLDASGDAEIDVDEFSRLCLILQLRFRRHDTRSLLEIVSEALGWLPANTAGGSGGGSGSGSGSGGCAATLRAMLTSRACENAVDFALVLSAISLALEATAAPQTGLSPAQLFFSVVFLIEVALKAALLPWRAHSRSALSRFDALVTLAACATSVAVYLPNGFDNGSVVRAVISLRMLRLLRLLRKVSAFRVIVATFLRVLPAATVQIKCISLLIFVFACVGLHLFGGIITTDDTSGVVITPEQAHALADSDFGTSGYYANNFNDLPSGCITLFELTVVNNWFVITDGYAAVRGKSARAFFIAYYLLGVVIGLNIVVAFVLDAYTTLEDQTASSSGGGDGGKGGGDADQLSAGAAGDGDALVVDAERVTGTETGITGLIEVSMMRTSSSVFVNTLSESRRAQLAALFERPAGGSGAAAAGSTDATSSAAATPEHPHSLRAIEARGSSWRDALTSTFKKPKDGAPDAGK